jgi:hypothetical protein
MIFSRVTYISSGLVSQALSIVSLTLLPAGPLIQVITSLSEFSSKIFLSST